MVNYKTALGAGMSLAGTLMFMSNADASTYVVQSGDTLNNIAKAHNTTLDYILANNGHFTSNPDLIFPGQEVYFPDDNSQAVNNYQAEASTSSAQTEANSTDEETQSSFNNNEQVTSSSVTSQGQGSQSDAEYAATRMASATGVSYDVWYKIIMRESGGNSTIYNNMGYYGLFQLAPGYPGNGGSVEAQIENAIYLYNNGGLAHWAETAY